MYWIGLEAVTILDKWRWVTGEDFNDNIFSNWYFNPQTDTIYSFFAHMYRESAPNRHFAGNWQRAKNDSYSGIICKWENEFHSADTGKEFNVIVATGWKNIELKANLNPFNGMDSDNDGLTDWEEVATEWHYMWWENNGKIHLPTVRDCINFASSTRGYPTYMEEGLKRYTDTSNVVSGAAAAVLAARLSRPVMPIHSDPTMKDTDGDGYVFSFEIDSPSFAQDSIVVKYNIETDEIDFLLN